MEVTIKLQKTINIRAIFAHVKNGTLDFYNKTSCYLKIGITSSTRPYCRYFILYLEIEKPITKYDLLTISNRYDYS